ncbi:MAG: VPLPA-CTERM sorting domain-containing protein, partial [Pseudomonadota bacterium]
MGNNNNPTIFQPESHGLVGMSEDGFTIGIQALAFDNDDNVAGDEDDFVLRFIGQTQGLQNNVTPLNFETFLDYEPVLIRNLSFSALNVGTFSATNARANALGGFDLEVVALAPVPLPAAGWGLLAGIGVLAGFARRKSKARQTAEL